MATPRFFQGVLIQFTVPRAVEEKTAVLVISAVLDQPALFEIVDGAEHVEPWSRRERRLLVGALNFHAVMAPGRDLVVHLYDGHLRTLPRTTGDDTFDGMSRENRRRLFTIRVRSLLGPEEGLADAGRERSLALTAAAARHLHISRDDVLAADPPRLGRTDLVGRAARAVRTRWPLVYDDLRDLELLRHRRWLRSAAPRQDYARMFAPGGLHADGRIVPAADAPEGAPRAVIVGLHWFELGGAERWAFESVRIVREAGLLPIVLTNRDSHHPWLERSELDGALIVPFSEGTVGSQTAGIEELLRGLLRTFDVRGAVVHHNQWLYDRLAWIRLSRAGIPIVDSTHIVEYRGGGFPVSSAIVSDAITTHHVISPTLADFMVETQGLPRERVIMAPLGGLTVEGQAERCRPRPEGRRFTIAFVGRMTRQKGPEVFIQMAARLRRQGHDFRYVMHGDGDQASWVDDMIAAAGLRDVLRRRDSRTPVADTYAECDLLVVCSHNEGLTLTTLEAIAHGVPVVSTDVGAQADIIPRRALTSRLVHRAVTGLTRVVARLADDERARERLWLDESTAMQELLAAQSASDWFAQEVRSW